MCELNLETCTVESATRIESPFRLFFLPGVFVLHGLTIYFSVDFDYADEPVSLWTSPDTTNTHWKQALVLFYKPVDR